MRQGSAGGSHCSPFEGGSQNAPAMEAWERVAVWAPKPRNGSPAAVSCVCRGRLISHFRASAERADDGAQQAGERAGEPGAGSLKGRFLETS